MAPPSRHLAVSVDVDPMACYQAIHGLARSRDAGPDPVMTTAVPRLIALFQELGVPATFFLVGTSLYAPEGQAAVGALVEAGFELANHSHTHPYGFGRLSAAEVANEIRSAHEAILAVSQQRARPVGFRAPGYALSRHAVAALTANGYTYDASLLPSPPYYLAKLAVLAKMRLRGRRSGSVLGHVGMVLGRVRPYAPDSRSLWRRGNAPVVELPMTCTPWLRLPVIGTSLALAPKRLAAYLVWSLQPLPLVSLELHALDLLDATDPGVPPDLVARQPDLRVGVGKKRAAIGQAIRSLLAQNRQAVTLAQAAGQYGRAS